MTADGIVSEFETTDHYLPFKCVQCGLEGFVEPTRRKRIYCGTKCNDRAFADKRKAETAQRRQAKIDQLKARTEKTCTKCGVTKPVSEFTKSKEKLDGYRSECNECKMVVCSAWASNNRERLRELATKRRQNPESRAKILAGKKRAIDKARELIPHNERAVLLFDSHVRQYNRMLVLDALHAAHVDRYFEFKKNERVLHDAHVKALRSNPSANFRFRYRTEPTFVLYHRIKTWMHQHIKEKRDSRKWAHILGYTPEQLRIHLEKQFTKGMSWENKGAWEIDHLLPVASFEINGFDDPNFHACYGLHNLRPIWKKENRDKRDKILFLL